ncbi:carbohydrate kinase family protein [Kribbella sp. NPDC055110]
MPRVGHPVTPGSAHPHLRHKSRLRQRCRRLESHVRSEPRLELPTSPVERASSLRGRHAAGSHGATGSRSVGSGTAGGRGAGGRGAGGRGAGGRGAGGRGAGGDGAGGDGAGGDGAGGDGAGGDGAGGDGGREVVAQEVAARVWEVVGVLDRRALVCVGDLVEDVVVWGVGVARVGTDNPARVCRTRGGAAANVAAFAGRLGVAVRFVGRVGDDAAGAALVRDLTEAGVDVKVQRLGRTGTIVVIVDESGERTMYPDRAAAAELADVPDLWLSGARAVHLSAYSLVGPSLSVLSRASAIARAEGAILTIDASSIALIDSIGPARFRDLIRTLHPTYLFANGIEADAGSLRDLATSGTTVVVKNGLEPTEIHLDANTSTTVPVPPVDEVRDTTGAGDAFAAGFLSAVLEHANAVEAVKAGHTLARRVLGEPGATLSMTADENGTACD